MQGVMIALPTTPRFRERSGRDSARNAGVPESDEELARAADAAPNYISPMLLRLIASNAPWELDVFSELLERNRIYERLKERKRMRQRDPVEALLATIRQYNKNVEDEAEKKPAKQGTRQRPRSSPSLCREYKGRGRNTGSSKECRRSLSRNTGSSKECSRSSSRNACGWKECSRSNSCNSKESSRSNSRSSKESTSRSLCRPHSGEKGRTCTRECKERNLVREARDARDAGGRARSCSRGCAARECGFEVKLPRLGSGSRPGSSSRPRVLPERPLTARDHSRMKETSLPERPKSARARLASENFHGRKSRTKRISRQQLDSEWENSSRDSDFIPSRYFSRSLRPASAGAVLASERAKPLWFRQASVKALHALERNLYDKLNISAAEVVAKARAQQMPLDVSNSRATGDERGRPVTAPASGPTAVHLPVRPVTKLGNHHNSERPQSKNFGSDAPPAGRKVVEAWMEDSPAMQFPITKKFLETNLERRCCTAPAPRKTPTRKERPPDPLEVDEGPPEVENDNFKDYVAVENNEENEEEEKVEEEEEEDSGSSCSEVELEIDENEEARRNEEAQRNSVNSCIMKLTKSLADSDKGMSELIRGVHESLQVSSKLAEVVELCSRRGQELLRARESMVPEKPPERTRWPVKLYRPRQSRATRRALRAQLKWSIFSNGGKLRALNPIYGGGKRNSHHIRFVGGDPRGDSQKQAKRPATAPAEVQKAPSDNNSEQQRQSSMIVIRRAEGIGPWTPTPEVSDARFRSPDAPNFVKNPDDKTHSQAQAQKRRAQVEAHREPQQAVDYPMPKLSHLSSFISAKRTLRRRGFRLRMETAM